MKSILLSVAVALSITMAFSQETITINLRVFPAKSIAGVIQLSFLNDESQPEYGFNVTEARDICTNLGLNLASKDQVTEALNRGFETCRFGWIDEHYAVVPRIKALSICGQNQTGLVSWRAALDKKFDVFCFNQSDYTAQPEEEMTTMISKLDDAPIPTASLFIFNLSLTSDLTLLDSLDGAQLARLAGDEQSSGKGKVVLITSACAVLLVAIAVLAYIKMKRRFQRADVTQEHGDIVIAS
ncbi:lymphatic vessel endothelial hyaluronic acid receptor 1a isoform X1 [Hippocampus zosterae]|uniref:lymphatic vessel endothelial hyaluronic acid receptor 1a isoform X1 n=2 Tax=Hippocampus zosterae TaxID=109293 RepID=UPI00223D5A07|nr:lymphatic vessel endothelial hyaluronic acid receptor 1a isoform X1 [Hippocampus zosterae]